MPYFIRGGDRIVGVGQTDGISVRLLDGLHPVKLVVDRVAGAAIRGRSRGGVRRCDAGYPAKAIVAWPFHSFIRPAGSHRCRKAIPEDGLRLRSFSFHVPLSQIVVDEEAHLTLLFLDWVARMVQDDIGGIAGLDTPPPCLLRPGFC
jgi:hypothetical protein